MIHDEYDWMRDDHPPRLSRIWAIVIAIGVLAATGALGWGVFAVLSWLGGSPS